MQIIEIKAYFKGTKDLKIKEQAAKQQTKCLINHKVADKKNILVHVNTTLNSEESLLQVVLEFLQSLTLISKKETFLIGKEIFFKSYKTWLFRNLWCKVSGIKSRVLSLASSINPKVSENINEDEENAEWLQYKEKSCL